MHLVTAPRVVTEAGLLAPGWVLFDERVREYGAGEPPKRVLDSATQTTTIDAGVLAPGLVDIQINGAFGVDFAAADDDAWTAVATRLPSTGCTAFVPTFITAGLDEIETALRAYTACRDLLAATPGAARSLGVHLEGPFLSERRRGAHRADLLRDPQPGDVERLLTAGGDDLLYVTLAPERDGAVEAITRLTSAGVRVAVGHCDADEPTVRQAADAGATLVTHLYNAQRPLHHRDPGTVGAGLTDDRLTCGLIVDLHHVAPAAVQVAFRAAQDRIALVTDAVAAMGMPTGRYELGGDVLEVRPGEPPRRADGAIAGSALRMDEAVAKSVRACGIDLVTAIDAATRVPADAVGRPDLGRVAIDGPADLVWLGDDLRAVATWIAGAHAWTRDADVAPVEAG